MIEDIECPFCKLLEVRQNKKRVHKTAKNGFYNVKNPINNQLEKVNKYICKICGEAFTKNLNLQEDYSFGYFERVKKGNKKIITRETKVINEKYKGPIIRKLHSKYRIRKQEDIFKKIDKYIIQKGILNISTLKRELEIGATTYYRYIKNLKTRSQFSLNTKSVPDKCNMKNLFLQEINIRTVKKFSEPKHVGEAHGIKILVLMDSDSGLVVGAYILLFNEEGRNKKFQNWKNYRPLLVIKDLKNKIEKYKIERIEVNCDKFFKRYLESKIPNAFAYQKKSTCKFLDDLKKFRIKKTMSYHVTILKNKKDILSEKDLSLALNKKYVVAKFTSFAYQIEQEIHFWLQIYNQHRLYILNKDYK
jgi:hypothetical protein